MIRSAAGKVMWVGRASVFLIGLAVVLALLFGVATTALSATGKPFILGKQNIADKTSKLIKRGAGAALRLQVQDGQPPLKVNSSGKVANLNADQLDGKSEADFYAMGSKVADSELLDGKESSEFAPAYKSTVVVSPVGTDTENGQALREALSGITDASATKRYLLYIEAGTYDVGTSTFRMKQHVDIQGSGELSTLITGSVSHCVDQLSDSGLLRGATNAELRFLTVRNTAPGQCNIAIYNHNTCPRFTHVTAEATGGAGSATTGVVNFSTCSSMTMTDVTATASGGADNRGVFNIAARPTIKQSKVSGSTYSLYQSDGSIVKVALSQLVGPVNVVSGTLQCFNNYNENLQPVTCT